jgi:hypothetical protein
MQLCKRTIDIFKNFATIDESFHVRAEGSVRAIGGSSDNCAYSILADAQVKERFDQDFAFYDFPRFLKALAIFSDPVLTFDDGYLIASAAGGRDDISYHLADPPTVQLEKPRITPDVTLKINFSAKQLANIRKTANLLYFHDIQIHGNEDNCGRLVIQVLGMWPHEGYGIDMGETDKKFLLRFDIDQLRVMPGDYALNIDFNTLTAAFVGADVRYIIPVEVARNLDN